MNCRVSININRGCKPRYRIISGPGSCLRVSLTISNIEDFRKLIRSLKKVLHPDNRYNLKIVWRNLPEFLRDNIIIKSELTSLFGDEKSRIDVITQVIREHMTEYGKYPSLANIPRVYNYIRSISNQHDLTDQELESIRLKLLYPVN